MNDPLIIGLDIGTTNIKACAYTAGGELVARTKTSYPTYYPNQGWAEQDPQDWQDATLHCLRDLVAKLGQSIFRVAGIGISAHAPGFIPVDGAGRSLLDRVPIWQDERCTEQGKALLTEIGTEWIGLGIPMAAFAAKLRWFSETYPEQVELAKYALGVKSFMVHWLTNEFATDPSSEPGFDLGLEKIWKACGWAPQQFVSVQPATTVIGELSSKLSEGIGLANPIPVVLGLNDGASATLANGAFKAGDAVLTLGTNGVIFLVSDDPIPTDERLEQALFCWPYVDDRWIVGGQTKTGACSLDWIGSIMQSSLEEMDHDVLFEEASVSPEGSGGIFFFPYLMGSGTPNDDPSAAGAMLGLTMPRTRGDLVRAVLEGVAFTLRDVQNELEQQGLKVERLWITGGGASSELWRDIVAHVLNQTLQYSNADSSLGAAMLASVGVGVHADIEVAQREMTPKVTINELDCQRVEIYGSIYREFSRKRDLILGIS